MGEAYGILTPIISKFLTYSKNTTTLNVRVFFIEDKFLYTFFLVDWFSDDRPESSV